MGKFEVCIRGTNFRIKTDKKVSRKNFYAARFVEATGPGEAVEKAMSEIRSELRPAVVNPASDTPKVEVVEVSQVYYFQENMVVEGLDNMVLPGSGFAWEELEEEREVIGNPMRPAGGRLPSLGERIKKRDLHFHSMSIHFTNSLYPIAVLFMFLFLLTGKETFKETYTYLITLATMSVPFSYVTGILQWRKKFQAMTLQIFYIKLRYGALVFVLGASATLWNLISPEVLAQGSLLTALFVILNLAVLAPLVYLGHLGGIIVYEGVEQE